MRIDVVGMSWLLNPEWLELYEFAAHAFRVRQGPALVGIEHQDASFADNVAQHRRAAQVAGLIGRSYLQLEGFETSVDGACGEFAHFLVVVSHPADGGV